MELLSIAIPTYNNSKFLDYLLEFQLPILEKYKIKIYISDNNSTDDTSEVINKWRKQYPLIMYRTNAIHLNSAQNCELAINLPASKYVWLLGDRYFIPEKTIKYVLDSLNTDPSIDLLLVNLEGLINDVPSHNYNNSEVLLSDLGHLMTCLSVKVINNTVINGLKFKNFFDSDFAHFCALFEYLNSNNFNALWSSEFSIKALSHPNLKRINWSHDERALSVGAKNWVTSVFSLSSDYSYDSKIKCIKKFGVLSKLFTFRGIVLMRMRGNLTYSTYKKYSREIRLIINYSEVIVVLMSVFPRSILKFLYALLSIIPKKITQKIGFVNGNE